MSKSTNLKSLFSKKIFIKDQKSFHISVKKGKIIKVRKAIISILI